MYVISPTFSAGDTGAVTRGFLLSSLSPLGEHSTSPAKERGKEIVIMAPA